MPGEVLRGSMAWALVSQPDEVLRGSMAWALVEELPYVGCS